MFIRWSGQMPPSWWCGQIGHIRQVAWGQSSLQNKGSLSYSNGTGTWKTMLEALPPVPWLMEVSLGLLVTIINTFSLQGHHAHLGILLMWNPGINLSLFPKHRHLHPRGVHKRLQLFKGTPPAERVALQWLQRSLQMRWPLVSEGSFLEGLVIVIQVQPAGNFPYKECIR